MNVKALLHSVYSTLLLALLASISPHAADVGTVNFNNRISGVLDAPVTLSSGSGAGTIGCKAQLVLVSGGNASPVGNPVSFRATTDPLAKYFDGGAIDIPGTAAGGVVTLRVRVFNGSDFASATIKGESADFTQTLGGGLLPPGNLDGLKAFVIGLSTPPSFSTQPASQVVAVGGTINLVVAVNGGSATYQWYKNNAAISGATAATLTVRGATENDSGTYRVTARNSAGATDSANAIVKVLASPVIASMAITPNPASRGDDVTLTVAATGSALTYEWRFGGAVVGTAATLRLPAVQLAAAGEYSVRVANELSFASRSDILKVLDIPFVQRTLPSGYVPGTKLVVALSSKPASTVQNYVIEDQPPADWTVGAISDGGVYDSANKKVKFGPFFENTGRTFTYEVTPPANASGTKTFSGLGAADGVLSLIAGTSSIDANKFHPADNAPADSSLSALEVTTYGSAWKRGTNWPIGPNPIPASYVTRAGALWKGGEAYQVDPTISQPPLWWVNITRQSIHTAGTPGTGDSARRQLEGKFTPGIALTVKLLIAPPAGTANYVVEESVPTGWQVSSISDGGTFDETNHKVKWGVFFDANARTLSYDLKAPASAHGLITFDGLASFDGADVVLGGGSQAVAASKLRSLSRGPNNKLTVTLDGSSGKDFTIEISSDLVHWTPVGKIRNDSGSASFSDDDLPGKKQRFYRAVEDQ